MNKFVEIRTYTLKPGARDDFDRIAAEQAIPMLRRWDVDVVAHGPSPHDDDSYYLIRAYSSLAERKRSQDAFYGSEEWKNGPQPAILSLIGTFTSVVLELDANTVDALRVMPRSERGART